MADTAPAPKPGTRKARALETRHRIMDSAISLFRERGYENVTMEDIARAAGTAKGTFYTHFATKSAIVVETFRTIDEYYREIAVALEQVEGARAKLVEFVSAQARYIRDRIGNALLRVLYANQVTGERRDQIIVNEERFWFTYIASIIRDGQESGEFRSELSAEDLGRWFNRAIRGNFLDWCVTAGEDYDLEEEARRFCEEFIAMALTAPAAG